MLAASVEPDQIAPGDSARITVALRNSRAQPVTITFRSGCVLLYEIEDASGKDLTPEGGGFGCFGAVTPVTIAAGGGEVRTFTFTGALTHYPPTGRYYRAEGSYRIFGTVESFTFGSLTGSTMPPMTEKARSAPVGLMLRRKRALGPVSDVAVGVRVDTSAADRVPVVVVRAENIGAVPATMRFSGSCRLTFLVRQLPKADEVARGGESCREAGRSSLTLAPREVVEKSFPLKSTLTDVVSGKSLRLDPGEYYVEAALGSRRDGELRSAQAFVRIR